MPKLLGLMNMKATLYLIFSSTIQLTFSLRFIRLILTVRMRLILRCCIRLVISLFPAIKIYFLYGFKHPSNYEGVIKPIRRINTELIVEEWDNIQRIMVSLAVKETTQSIIVGTLSAYARKNKTRRALWEYDNILKSLYLLDYVQELMNQQGNTHQIIVDIDGVRTFERDRIVEQRDANTFVVHPPSKPDKLYQVSNRTAIGHQIISERITGKGGRKVVTSIESLTWVDEEILPRLNKTIDRYPDAQMCLTGSIDIDDPDQITPRSNPQQLSNVTKQGRKLEFNSCPLTSAIGLLRDQWGSGQIGIRVIITKVLLLQFGTTKIGCSHPTFTRPVRFATI